MHKYARLDCKYWNTIKALKFDNFILLKDIFSIISGSVQTSHYVEHTTSIPYIRIGDIDYKFGILSDNIIFLDEETHLPPERILKANDLIMATIGATIGKVGRAHNVVGGTHSNNTVILRPKHNDINCYFYEKLLQSDYYINYIYGLASQKAQPNLQLYEIENIKFPFISDDKIKELVKRFACIDAKIATLKNSVLSVQNAIDSVFESEFHFHYDTLQKLTEQKNYNLKQSSFSDNVDLRLSVKYHRPAGKYVMQQLLHITNKKIKHFLAEPIVLGASITPKDFDEEGTAYYVSMATIKTLELELDDTQLVSPLYYASHKSKTLAKDDIILARSGVAIGKTAIVKKNFKGIFSDFTMRIRLDKSKCNPLFAYYYFRSKYFQYLIETHKKGLQNQNIFPIIVQEFPMPDITLEKQELIVKKIQKVISKQHSFQRQMNTYKKQIDDIIITALKETAPTE